MTRAGGPAAFVTLGALLAAACRDAPAPFRVAEPPPLGPAPYQLTFDPAREWNPSWASGGDTVYYISEVTDAGDADRGTAGLSGAVLALPPEGGTARRALPLLQPQGSSAALVDRATVSVDGRVAVYFTTPLAGSVCGTALPFCDVAVGPASELDGALVRVRDPAAGGSPDDDPVLVLEYAGRSFDTADPPDGLTGRVVVEVFPFQSVFTESRRYPSGMSWSPAGDELVLSDGLGLLRWNPDTGATTSIPNAQDGINPRWSPTGDWIVFERLERGAARETTCEHRLGPVLQCVERRVEYSVPRRKIALIRPDGGGLRLIGEGMSPAWSHDERWIYYERDDRIWRVDAGGVEAAPVPDTEGGYAPSPSPDGRFLAFARFDRTTGESDIWILRTSAEG